jgi:CubicO group peptidase (beta-lactamase class C family)
MRPLALALTALGMLLDAPRVAAQRDLSRVDSVVARVLQEQRIPGVSVYIGTTDGRTLFAKGYGTTSLAGGQPVTPATIFPVMSVSKPFTAALVIDSPARDACSSTRRSDVTSRIFRRGATR